MFSFLRKKTHSDADPAMNYLVVGLGNIGAEYTHTRHNAGFMVLDAWVKDSPDAFFESARYGSTAVTSYKGRKIYLLKPSTYMNLSGNAVRYWVEKLKIPVSNVVVISDDLNIPFGMLRMRLKGSDGGHNGLKSIAECLGTQDYARIRIGIGSDFHRGEQIDFVLGELGRDDELAIEALSPRIRRGIELFCTAGPAKAMEEVNSKPALQEGQ